jgi:uncharacterized protein YkwD
MVDRPGLESAVKSLLFALLIAVAGCTGEITGPLGDEGAPDAGVVADEDGGIGIDAAVAPLPDGGPVAACGDGSCGAGESCGNCASDCGPCAVSCGDGICAGDETCTGCPGDCGSCTAACGDDVCDGLADETCTACAADCDSAEVRCGNGECQAGESSASCRIDCGPAQWQLDWAAWEEEVRVRVNAERAAGTDCPNGAMAPAGPLAMNQQLRAAARLHSWDMDAGGYFAHDSCNGRTPWQRAAAQGTSAAGEVIGWGYASAEAMVAGWMGSPGHCAILMNPSMTEIGVGVAAESGRLWTGLLR